MNIENTEIVEKWFMSIAGASGEGDKLMEDFMLRIRDVGIPTITAKTAELNVGVRNTMRGFLKGGGSQKHEFVEIGNEHLPHYAVYAGSRDYGKLLIVSWFLIVDKHRGNAAANVAAHLVGGGDLTNLTIFESEELSAFASVAHEALKDAIEEMMKGKNLDFTKVDTHTRGILNLS